MKYMPWIVGTQERLILEGIQELNEHGYQKFSVRRIAEKCGVSCAAPYKHFKNKHDYVATIIGCIYQSWLEANNEVVVNYQGSLRKQLTNICIEYIRFLVENPYFRSLLMQKDDEFDREYPDLRNCISNSTRQLIAEWAKEHHVADDVLQRKVVIMRAMLYGIALMFDNGELEYTEENLQIIHETIDREFDLP